MAIETSSTAQALSPIGDDDLALLLLIRHFEQGLLDAFGRGILNGTTHTCIGQEYIPVALSGLLAAEDFQLSNHRGHGHYLARFDDPEGLLAEIMGRQGAICNGVGGSQHIYRDRQYLSTGIQGESLPIAAGAGLHFKQQQRDALVVAHVGDGTWGEGAVYEALNMASLWQLPLLVAVENNHIAQTTPAALQMAGDIRGRAAAFGIAYLHVTGHDVAAIRARLQEPVAAVRAGRGPLVVEFDTVRLGPHSKGDDTRSAEELAALRARDWYADYQRSFPEQFQRLESQAAVRVQDVFRRVEAAAPSTWVQP